MIVDVQSQSLLTTTYVDGGFHILASSIQRRSPIVTSTLSSNDLEAIRNRTIDEARIRRVLGAVEPRPAGSRRGSRMTPGGARVRLAKPRVALAKKSAGAA